MKGQLNITFVLISLITVCLGQNERGQDFSYSLSDKERFVGNWKLIRSECRLFEQYQDSTNWSFPLGYADQFNDQKFLNQVVSRELRLRFESDSLLSVSPKIMYYYRFDEKTIQVYKCDNVITLTYIIKGDLLIITEKLDRVIKRSLAFLRE